MKTTRSLAGPRVVPIRKEQPQTHTPYYYLANEVGELKLLVEKLTYRLQQTERRHAALIRENQSLKARLAKLRERGTPPKRSRPKQVDKPKPVPIPPPSPVETSSPQAPDYWEALAELNNSNQP